MTQKGNRQQGTPYFLTNNESLKMERIPLDEKFFQENWLQNLIHNNPQILPIDDIESGFAPLISIGREISTSVGFVDNLYISPNGYITIVETKLWRNPEAKREVVGQIIDYAKELSSWTFSKLNEGVIKSSQTYNKNTKGIIELIKDFEDIEEIEEYKIIDNIERNLKRGRFLLLIVGDGIRESVEDMIDFLSNSPQIQFTLGLVELQVYKNPNNEKDWIVIPNLITRTREITRAIIKIENSNPNSTVTLETNFKEDVINKSPTSRSTITEDDFFEQLKQNTDSETSEFAKRILNDAKVNGHLIDWNQGSFAVKHLDPDGSGQKISLFVVDRKGLFYHMSTGHQLKRLGLPTDLANEYALSTAKLLKDMKQNPKIPDTWSRYAKILEIKPIYSQFLEKVEQFIRQVDEKIKATA